MGRSGKVETNEGAGTPILSQSLPRRMMSIAVMVALCAAIASGSCAFSGNGEALSDGDMTVAGAVLFPAFLSGGLALVVALLYFHRVRRWPEAKIFAALSVVTYITGMLGAWSPLLYLGVGYFAVTEGVPWAAPYLFAGLALTAFSAGGLIASWTTKVGITGFSWLIALVCGIAIAIAAMSTPTKF